MKNLIVLITAICLSVSTFAQNGLSVGSKAPDFTGKDQNGKTVRLKEKLKQGPVVLVFYRGYWCPNCSRELKSLQDSLTQLASKKATVIAVSPETNEGVAKSVKNAKATYSFISDAGLKILKLYDVAFTITPDMDEIHKKYNIDVEGNNGANGKILPRPATYIINSDGTITYKYFNTKPYSDPKSAERVTVKEIIANLSK